VRRSRPYFFPFALPIVALLLVLVLGMLVMLEVGVLDYAYEKLGMPHRAAMALLVLSLLGSYVNLPVAELPAERILSGQQVVVFGMSYTVPVVEDWPSTLIAVNVGGAIVPVLLSLLLLFRTGLFGPAAVAIAIVALGVHALARPVPGVGIAVPALVPPVIAALAAYFLAPDAAPAVAYVAGSLGTLIGADLLNLHRIRGLGAPVASIGGAGTFDGIFLTGILAVLLA
jgi:uncharacterized membrane protein